MQELWSSASYEPHLLSLPFAFAPAAMLVVVAYGLVMRGEPTLRAWMLVHFLALLPYSIVMTLSPSVVSEQAAEELFRIAAAFIPLAAAAGAGFQFRVLGRDREVRWFLWFAIAVAAVWIVLGATTDLAVSGVQRLRAGLWYARSGDYAWLALVSTVLIATPGFLLLARAALTMKPSPLRRQLRFVLAANVITYSGMIDVTIAYDAGIFPLGWLVSGAGSVLVARALVTEDLLRVRAIDTTAPRLVLHLAGAMLVGAFVLRLVGEDAPWWIGAIAIAIAFASVRVTLAVIALIARGARTSESTLDRLIAQLVARARPLEHEPAIAELASDVIELGIGDRPIVLVAASDDYGWSTATGARLPDEAAPDPLLGAWLAEHRAAVFAHELDGGVPADLRDLLGALLERHAARALVPVASDDDLLAVVLLPAAPRRLARDGSPGPRSTTEGRRVVLSTRERTFLDRACERLGEAILHARMARRAAERALIARQVELAAALQQQLLPGTEPHVHGNVTVIGSWLPATRCAGDFWGVYPLGARGVLVAIGDVTGHGVASATVTAAAAAAVDVIVRRRGADLKLPELVTALDAAVRRVGAGQLTMTCFAAVLEASQIEFVSCGHPTPYVVRPREGGDAELQALVGRGNPVGSGSSLPKVQHKPLRAGDLVVWYTDGVVEAQDPSGEAFGDRRLQRMLKRLDRAGLSAASVHDVIGASIAAHRGGQPRVDDETLVVAEVRA